MKFRTASVLLCMFMLPIFASTQEAKKIKEPLTPYVGVLAGGCGLSSPFTYIAGVEKKLKPRVTIGFDFHYMNTRYECYCDDTYSRGRFKSYTPSVKIQYNTGKRSGRGLIFGVGLGYMIARDKGFEQPYLQNETGNYALTGKLTPGTWHFNSIAPSFTVGLGFRMFQLPLSGIMTTYFANTTNGFYAVTGGAGIKVGFRKIE